MKHLCFSLTTTQFAIALLISVGVMASFGFQDPPGPGVVTDYLLISPNPPNGIQPGECYTMDGFGNLIGSTKLSMLGRCDNGLQCSPTATCMSVGSLSNNPLIPTACKYAKTYSSVLTGTCESATHHQCHYCPPGTQMVCHIYRLFKTKTGTGTYDQACGAYLIKWGGTCLYEGP